jgi:hypothetical protein
VELFLGNTDGSCRCYSPTSVGNIQELKVVQNFMPNFKLNLFLLGTLMHFMFFWNFEVCDIVSLVQINVVCSNNGNHARVHDIGYAPNLKDNGLKPRLSWRYSHIKAKTRHEGPQLHWNHYKR